MPANPEAITTQPVEREMVITRVFDAPREMVFNAWTDPDQVKKWWGPASFTNPRVELDVRPGGALTIHMQGPDGAIYPTTGTFNEIVKPERLIFTGRAFEDDEGNSLMEVLTTVIFEEEDGKTRLTIQSVITRAMPEAEGALAGMQEGWNQSFDKLADHLADV